MNQWASLKNTNQLIANHSAAPVCHKQNPILIAPANSKMIFHGKASKSSKSRILKTKKSIVETRMIAVLFIG